MHRHTIIAFALAVVGAGPLAAQALPSLALDVTVGSSTGYGGTRDYVSYGDFAAEVTLALRLHPDRGIAPIAAMALGRRGGGVGNEVCFLNPGQNGCRPGFPAFSHFGLLGGFEGQASHTAVRVLAGPAFYYGGRASAGGGQLQRDGAIGFAHVAFVAATRGSWLVRFKGEDLRSRSIELGIRIQ